MRAILLLAVALTGCTGGPMASGDADSGAIDYAYLDGDPAQADRQKVVVIGMSFSKDTTKLGNCQTRTRSGDSLGDWHDAKSIVHAWEDEYQFKPADLPSEGVVIETRVKDSNGDYTSAIAIAETSNYIERFRTVRSPHDYRGNTVQILWCRDPEPALGPKICPNTIRSLACQTKDDYAIMGIHFAPGTVSKVKIAFDYSQVDVNNSGPVSDSALKLAIKEDDKECPKEGAFESALLLNKVHKPGDPAPCHPANHTATPGKKDKVVYYMFKRKSWPAVLNINNVVIETAIADADKSPK